MGIRRKSRVVVMGLGLSVALVAAGCSSSGNSSPTTTKASTTATTSSGSGSDTATGVTATQIDIGAISSKTGQLAGYFGGLDSGMKAYFNVINAKGGINGRKLVLTADLDDGGSPAQFTQDTHNLIDQDHVFAIGVASAWFSPNYFVATKTPTYGYNVSANWETSPNLFAVGGSTQIYSSAYSSVSWVLKKLKVNSVAFISYGPSIASSYDACSSYAKGMQGAGFKVYSDVGAQLGGNFSTDVQRIQQSGATMVVSCMQGSDNIAFARSVNQYGLKIKQMWLNGYDQALLDQYPSEMSGVYLNLNDVVPFEAGTAPKFGNTYAGMQQYIAAMKKYAPADVFNGVAFDGWQSAALIAAGVQAAGKNPTQASVIDATNNITDFTAGGLSSPVNWKVAHTTYTTPECSSYVQVQGKKFVSVLAEGKQVFVCVNSDVKNPKLASPPPGLPGAP